MQDILSQLDAIRRPRLLLRAARIGADGYNRRTHLARILGHALLPRSGPALMQLMEIEAELDQRRRQRNGDYRVSQHVEVMCALLGEARLLRTQTLVTP
ncbi:DUF6477 family protein [Thalassococcus sp. BH17M4-6]|uniref:DUF6477 family protein n=1 Tax=Thalassococcus sp. BH17M4-6 TaxID=3413148 RepID=UPI003BCDC80E